MLTVFVLFFSCSYVKAADNMSFGTIDTPRQGEVLSPFYVKYVQVNGWVIDPNGVEKIEVYIDNEVVGTAIYGISRGDVSNAYPQYSNSLYSGFTFRAVLSDLKSGKHVLSLKELSVDGTSKVFVSMEFPLEKYPQKIIIGVIIIFILIVSGIVYYVYKYKTYKKANK